MAVNSLYIGSLYAQNADRVAPLPARIRDNLPGKEPRPAPGQSWVYRVSEPFYTQQGVANVNKALQDGMISSASTWPAQLSEKIKEVYGVPVAFPCSSGATALLVAFIAGDVGPGDHVLVPSFTMVAVANAVKMVGATPIYVDCAEGQLNPSVKEYMAKATPKVKCVVTCHTFGVPADIAAIATTCREQNWLLVEDICEAIGTTAGGKLCGTFGDFACGSLYANKVITAGDGGWVHCADPKRHDRVKSIINHGFDPLYHFLHFETAPNAKVNGLGAALAVASFDHLDDLSAHRHQMATQYRKHLKGVPIALMQEGERDEPWVFGAVTKEPATKEALRVHLAEHGIETRNYFFPMHLEPVNFFQGTQTYEIPLPESERLATCGFYFPSHRYLEEDDIAYISACTRQFFDKSVAVPKAPRKADWVVRKEDPAPIPNAKRRKLNGVNGH